ncbi:MAG: ABC transporter permease, partial [Cupriavidus necator]
MNPFILRLLARRVGLALISLLAVSAIVFAITAVLPGDAAQEQLGQDATPEALAALRTQMGLDVPAPVRYVHWLGGMVTGNAGESLVTRMPVSEAIGSRLPQSLLLAGLTALISVPVALGLGI